MGSSSSSSHPNHSSTSLLGVSSLLPDGILTLSPQSSGDSSGTPTSSTSQGFFSNGVVVAAAFAIGGILVAFILLTLFICRRRHQRKRQQNHWAQNVRTPRPHTGENPLVADSLARSDLRDSASMLERQNSLKKPLVIRTPDEQAMEHTESKLSTQGLDRHRSVVRNDTLHETWSPRLARNNHGIIVNSRNWDSDDPLARQTYCPKPQNLSYGNGTLHKNHSLMITPSRAYLPFPNWRRVSDTPSCSSVHPSTPPTAEEEPDHQLPTPTSIACLNPAVVPNPSYSWGASAKNTSSYRSSASHETHMMTTPDSEDDRGPPIARRQNLSSDGLRQSFPPSIPPKNPLRKAHSMRTMLNVRNSNTPERKPSLSGSGRFDPPHCVG